MLGWLAVDITPLQFYAAVAATPIATIVAVIFGVFWSNNNLNARIADVNARISDLAANINNGRFADVNARINDLRAEMIDRINDTRDVLRAEMAKNHAEVMGRIAELETRLR